MIRSHSVNTFTPNTQRTSKRGRKKKPRNVNYTPTLTVREPTDGARQEAIVTLGHDELEALRLKGLNNLGVVSAAKQMGISKSLFAKIYKEAVTKVSNALIYGKKLHIDLRGKEQEDAYGDEILFELQS